MVLSQHVIVRSKVLIAFVGQKSESYGLVAPLIPDLTEEELKGARVWEKVAEKCLAGLRSSERTKVARWLSGRGG